MLNESTPERIIGEAYGGKKRVVWTLDVKRSVSQGITEPYHRRKVRSVWISPMHKKFSISLTRLAQDSTPAGAEPRILRHR